MVKKPLIEYLAQVEDKRKNKGKRHPLLAILGLVCAAMLCGCKTYRAISEWGRNQGASIARKLGFTHEKTPCPATLFLIFQQIEVRHLEGLLGAWSLQFCSMAAFAIDGKTLRGSKKQGATGTHLLSVVSHQLGITVAQKAIEEKSNEIPSVIPLLETLVLKGCVFTMDALLTQFNIADFILHHQGDYLMVVKDNQSTLRQTLEDQFRLAPETITDQAVSLDSDHGRIEERILQTVPAVQKDFYWPGAQQWLKIERKTWIKKQGFERQEVVYGITSLAFQKADAPQLLSLLRGHWTIENRSHYVRDVTFDEDRSQVRKKSIPQIMAAFRNAAIGLIRLEEWNFVPSAQRFFSAKPKAALKLVGFT